MRMRNDFWEFFNFLGVLGLSSYVFVGFYFLEYLLHKFGMGGILFA